MVEKQWQIGEPVFEADHICPNNKVWPWNGHRLFAYDLVRFLNPELYVELGTYWGNSFFSICQAVKDHNLGTRCVAIDTWDGDLHTGSYETKVFDTVHEIISTYFNDLDVELIRSLFSQAVTQFSDESIDLLHLDGLHTYEAVCEDFQTWLPKLSKNGVVLFHDIADSCDYGSVKYWQEISSEYPSLDFQHSWGLGILFPKEPYYFDLMVQNNIFDKLKIYEYASELNLTRLQKTHSCERNDRQDALIKFQERSIADMENKIEDLKTTLNRIQGSIVWKCLDRIGYFS